MTLLAPWFLVAAALAAAGTVLLHLIAVQRPPAVAFPTARFIPDAPARARARAPRPTDRLLLLLRVLALLLLGLAFARPVVLPERQGVRRIVLADRSRAVAATAAVHDTVRAFLAAGDVLVPFDSAASALAAGADTAAALAPTLAPGRLSAALVAARRLATALRDSTDSLELVLVSPLAAEEVDAATLALRAGWPGRLRVVRVAAAPGDSARGAFDSRIALTRPLGAAAAFVPRAGGRAPVRLVAAAPSVADSAFAREGGVLVTWPDSLPAGWSARAAPDTVGAVTSGPATVVASFVRAWRAGDGAVLARWVDGEPAATEQPLGAGCLRTVGVPVSERGDLALRPALHRLVQRFAEPCGGLADRAPLADSAVAALAGAGPERVAVQRATSTARSALAPWLLGAALALLVAEMLVRGGRREER